MCADQTGDRPTNPRVLFARIGWMSLYNGPQENDPRPIGGGSYTQDNVGFEVFNFRDVQGKCNGHFELPGRASEGQRKKLNIARIAPMDGEGFVSGVLVIFVAKRPVEGGQVVVGWYKNADVYRECQSANAPPLLDYWYYCRTDSSNAVLLPSAKRIWEVPSGEDGFGRANICYTLAENGTDRGFAWQQEIVERIQSYAGDNVLGNPVLEMEEVLAKSRGGQGYGLNAAERRLVEDHAMNAAKTYYEGEGYAVEDTHTNHPYDLICRNADETFYVEVKGTTSGGDSIFLTKNEVTHNRDTDHQCVLFVFHSIQFDATRANVTGGVRRILNPWTIDETALTALQYQYELPR